MAFHFDIATYAACGSSEPRPPGAMNEVFFATGGRGSDEPQDGHAKTAVIIDGGQDKPGFINVVDLQPAFLQPFDLFLKSQMGFSVHGHKKSRQKVRIKF